MHAERLLDEDMLAVIPGKFDLFRVVVVERRDGDHIDVWNGYRSSTKWLMEWFFWLGYYSNYAEAGEIWFWEVK